MSIEAYKAVWTRSRARGAMHHTLLAFADFADDDGLCWPSAATIAALRQIDERSARREIAALVAGGELIPVRKGRRNVVVYRIACLDPGYVGRPPLAKTPGVTPDQNVRGQNVTPDENVTPTPDKNVRGTPDENVTRTVIEPPLEPSESSTTTLVDAAFDDWNELATELGLAPVQRLTSTRRSALADRLAECGGLDGWRAALDNIRASPFLRGEGDSGWRITFDWLLEQTNFARTLEGAYESWTKPANGSDERNSESNRAVERAGRLYDELRGHLALPSISKLISAGLTGEDVQPLLADQQLLDRIDGLTAQQTCALVAELRNGGTTLT